VKVHLKSGDIHMKGEIFSILLNRKWEQVIVDAQRKEEVERKASPSLNIMSLQQEELLQLLQCSSKHIT
jgi:hypothetical protein